MRWTFEVSSTNGISILRNEELVAEITSEEDYLSLIHHQRAQFIVDACNKEELSQNGGEL